ncbi:hypothetical protein CIRG_00913 [Coccidioides immitis RMSCC 2394]|uniref:Uncharacterized protein n=1 Tax=Coccidioides immitis RMSCC 2394 TaxID=404692 RepID=A0A0J6XX56_COCIT|nr:hypothetical protein CIRG_00913 [Coccidioides immitis RMSCC 2394]
MAELLRTYIHPTQLPGAVEQGSLAPRGSEESGEKLSPSRTGADLHPMLGVLPLPIALGLVFVCRSPHAPLLSAQSLFARLAEILPSPTPIDTPFLQAAGYPRGIVEQISPRIKYLALDLAAILLKMRGKFAPRCSTRRLREECAHAFRPHIDGRLGPPGLGDPNNADALCIGIERLSNGIHHVSFRPIICHDRTTPRQTAQTGANKDEISQAAGAQQESQDINRRI